MDERKRCGPREEDADANNYSETRADGERSRSRERFCAQRLRLHGEQAFDASGEIVIASAKRSVEKRKSRSRTHSRYAEERCRQRKRAMRISAHGFIISSPLRKLCPNPLDGRKTAEQGNWSWRQKKKEALEIIARTAMRIFVLQSQVQLFRGKRTEHGLRNDQSRMKDAGERQERSVFFHNHGL